MTVTDLISRLQQLSDKQRAYEVYLYDHYWTEPTRLGDEFVVDDAERVVVLDTSA